MKYLITILMALVLSACNGAAGPDAQPATASYTSTVSTPKGNATMYVEFKTFKSNWYTYVMNNTTTPDPRFYIYRTDAEYMTVTLTLNGQPVPNDNITFTSESGQGYFINTWNPNLFIPTFTTKTDNNGKVADQFYMLRQCLNPATILETIKIESQTTGAVFNFSLYVLPLYGHC